MGAGSWHHPLLGPGAIPVPPALPQPPATLPPWGMHATAAATTLPTSNSTAFAGHTVHGGPQSMAPNLLAHSMLQGFFGGNVGRGWMPQTWGLPLPPIVAATAPHGSQISPLGPGWGASASVSGGG